MGKLRNLLSFTGNKDYNQDYLSMGLGPALADNVGSEKLKKQNVIPTLPEYGSSVKSQKNISVPGIDGVKTNMANDSLCPCCGRPKGVGQISVPDRLKERANQISINMPARQTQEMNSEYNPYYDKSLRNSFYSDRNYMGLYGLGGDMKGPARFGWRNDSQL